MDDILVGSWLNTASPIAAELMAASGMDFLTVDAEHSAVDLADVQGLFQAIRAGSPDCQPMVRVPSARYAEVKRYMDAGAGGVVCPLVNDSATAEELVSAVKYPPRGRRGLGFCRDNTYGLHLQKRLQEADGESLVCIQIEHIDGVRNLPEILSVSGIDAVFIGPYDLTASMGIPGQFEHPDYLDACQHILAESEKRKIAPGIHVVQPDLDALASTIEQGYRLIAFSLDITMLADWCRRCAEAVNTIKKASS